MSVSFSHCGFGPEDRDVARWNDRTTPRKTLETFYFAISGYDRSPSPDRQRDRLPRPERPRSRDARAGRGVAGPSARVHLESPGHPTLRSPRSPRGRPRRAGRGGRAADRPGPTGRRTMAVRLRDRRADRAAEEACLGRPARGSGGQGPDGRGPDRPGRDDPLVRRGRNGPARLRDGRPMPGPPRHPSPSSAPPRARRWRGSSRS